MSESNVGISILQRSRAGEDQEKALYLSYRACYLSENESLKLARITSFTLEKWREDDPAFYNLEVKNLTEFQDSAHRKALGIEYVRNYRLVLVKDMSVIQKSIFAPEDMTNADNQYLNKMRGSYTPEGLDRLSRIVKGDGSDIDDLLVLIREREVYIKERRSDVHSQDKGNGDGLLSADSPSDSQHIIDSGPG